MVIWFSKPYTNLTFDILQRAVMAFSWFTLMLFVIIYDAIWACKSSVDVWNSILDNNIGVGFFLLFGRDHGCQTFVSRTRRDESSWWDNFTHVRRKKNSLTNFYFSGSRIYIYSISIVFKISTADISEHFLTFQVFIRTNFIKPVKHYNF